MPNYIIERTIPGAGKLSQDELRNVFKQSFDVLNKMDRIELLHSYINDDKICCLYYAVNEDLIRKHVKDAGFPFDSVSPVSIVTNKVTSE